MFTLYHTNRLDLILHFVIKELIKQDHSTDDNNLDSYVITEEIGMLKWIQKKLEINFDKKISIEFLLIKEYMSKNYFHGFFIEDLNIFSELELTWKFFNILSDKQFRNDFISIGNFLKKDFYQKKSLFLSKKMSILYQRYLFFCPEWIKELQYNSYNLKFFEFWQVELWNCLIRKENRFNVSQSYNIHLFFHWIVKKIKFCLEIKKFPKKIFLIGISVFPPILIFILKKISQHTKIHIVFFNPSKMYWQDVNSDDDFLLKLNYKNYPNFLELDQEILFLQKEKFFDKMKINDKKIFGNPILVSLGNQGRVALRTLEQIENSIEIDAFFDFSKKTLLSCIQRDILLFRNSSFNMYHKKFNVLNKNKKIYKVSDQDQSFSIHMCCNIRREIEILYESILNFLSKNSTLCPSDVIVMAPDINIYVPYIKSIFGQRFFSFFIHDRKIMNVYPILSVFFSLLDIAFDECGLNEILSFLEHQEIASNFFIRKKEILILYEWVSKIEVYFPISSKFLQNIINNPNHEVWDFCRFLFLKRKNFLTNDEEIIKKFSKKYIPKRLKINKFCLVDRFRKFLRKFFYWRKIFSRLYLLEDWIPILYKFIENFFFSYAKTEEAFFFLKKEIFYLFRAKSKFDSKKLISITLLKEILLTQLSSKEDTKNFLSSDSINFCNLVSMRSIPAKIICLIGMNKEEFPRSNSLDNFNLMEKYNFHYKNYNSYEKDKYLFLETLLSAQNCLYVSFIGSTIEHVKNLSSVVEDILDYILKSFFISLDEKNNFKGNVTKENFLLHILKIHRCTELAQKDLYLKRKKNCNVWSFSISNYISNNRANSSNTFNKKLISIDEILSFYKHPIRFWFQKKLKISFLKMERMTVKNNLLFPLDTEELFLFKNSLLDFLVYHDLNNTSLQEVNLFNYFFHKNLQHFFWKRQYQDLICIANQVNLFKKSKKDDLLISQSLYEKKIFGTLKDIQADGLLRWKPYKLSIVDILQLWIEHLFYCVSGRAGVSRIFGVQSTWSFSSIEVKEAKELLSHLIDGYNLGMTSPLILLGYAGNIWLKYCYDLKEKKVIEDPAQKKIAIEKIVQSWEGNDFFTGKKKDPYLQKVIPNLREDSIIDEIIQNIKKYYLLPYSLGEMEYISYT